MIKRPLARSKVSIVRVLGTLLVGAAIGYVAWRGWSFYRLPLEARPDHPEFRKLKPSGLVGQGYGVAATLLIFFNLAYLIRRRFASARVGSMKVWLELHVFTGLLAGVFAAAHSALQVRTPLAAVTAASLAIVIVTGGIGRWFYSWTVRSNVGVAPMLGTLESYVPGFAAEVRAVLADLPVPKPPLHGSLYSALRAHRQGRACARARRAAVQPIVAKHLAALEVAPRTRADVERRMVALCDGVAAEARAGGTNALLRSWRALHRLFALTMLVTVVVHIGVAWYFGYRWIFSR